MWLAQVFGHVRFFSSFMDKILCAPGELVKTLVCLPLCASAVSSNVVFVIHSLSFIVYLQV